MPAIRRRIKGAGLGVLLGAATAIVLTIGQPFRVAASEPIYVKYYVVESSYQGHPETLAAIAARLLGTSSRAAEIFDLNDGRVQPDGSTLSDPSQLHAGWALALPWDAFGPGVHYGLLPTATPPPATPPTSSPSTEPSAGAPPAGQCASTGEPANGSQEQWGVLRIAPDHAWPHTRGANVLVAVADSGVDAGLPALSGRIAVGADIVSGTGRGDTDCLGSGTAMASIIAARGDAGGSLTGVAPEASILPVRLVTGDPQARPADQAAAIEFATAAGARVIALGGSVVSTEPAVAAAIVNATAHDVVVVVGAPVGPNQNASPTTPVAADGVLRVGAVGIDGGLAVSYAPGSVDVVAPGVGVAALGISGAGSRRVTGTPYAVSFVAGEVALVRARFPELKASQVVHRVKATADQLGGSSGEFGAGLINPGVAVTRLIPEENQPAAPPGAAASPPGSHPFRFEALIIMGLLALATVTLLFLRMRRMIQRDPPVDGDDAPSTPDASASPDWDGVAATPFAAAGPGDDLPGPAPVGGAPRPAGYGRLAGRGASAARDPRGDEATHEGEF